MKRIIYSISDSDKHFASAVDEYLKRLGRDTQVFDLKPSKKSSPAECITYDTNTIIDKLKGFTGRIVLLSTTGKSLTTIDFHKRIYSSDQPVIIIIGGPYGLDESRITAHLKLNFGLQTMPHGLAKLVILEQIYRAGMIEQGREYHY